LLRRRGLLVGGRRGVRLPPAPLNLAALGGRPALAGLLGLLIGGLLCLVIVGH